MPEMISTPQGLGLNGGENALLRRRPYIANSGRYAGHPVVAHNTGQMDASGNPIYEERPIQVNADSTLRKDEWIDLEDQIIESARERLVIIDDLREAGLTYNVGGIGTQISEWESGSEVTDGVISMDGESAGDKDNQNFSLHGVPIPVVHKEFQIGARQLESSRTRGAALDVTTGTEAARSVARASEKMVFHGARIGAVNSAGNSYSVPGLVNYANRATFTMSDWSDDENVSPEDIHSEILQMVRKMETEERHYGPFNIYIPGAYAYRFREDFKEFSDKTLMERVLDEDVINRIRVSDVLEPGNVLMIEMRRSVLDLAVGADITTTQWQSGSQWTNQFQVFAVWAPRLKSSYDGYTGILHASL